MLSTSTEKVNSKKSKNNVEKHTTRKTETQDNMLTKTQTGSRNPPEKINF
jgi:hypothetical protein